MNEKNPSAEPPGKTVKIDRVLAGKAHVVASDRGISMTSYVSSIIRSPIESDWVKIIRRLNDENPK